MGSATLRPSLLLLGALTACKAPAPDPAADGASGETLTALVRTLTLAHRSQADGELSVGYDLDGVVTQAGDASGCGIPDMVAPDGTPGIDSNFARILPTLDQTEAVAVYGLIQAAIASGELLLLFEISGVDDPFEDEDVDFTLYRGMGEPLLDTTGLVAAGQTLDRDPDVEAITVEGMAIHDGVLDVKGIEALYLPIQIFDVSLDLYAFDAGFRVRLFEDGRFDGFFAGGTPIQPFMDLGDQANIDAALGATLKAVLPNLADLSPDESGQCQNISVTFGYTAVPAWFYAD